MHSWPAQEGTPVESQTQNELGPVREPLHQRVEHDESHRAGTENHRVPVELKQHQKTQAELTGQKD